MNSNSVFRHHTFYWIVRHPIRIIREFFDSLRAAHQRAKNGWCYTDAYNLDTWLLEVLPPMLRVIANDITYPGTDEFNTWEKWHDWLLLQAENLDRCKEDALHNEYEDDFFKACDDKRLYDSCNNDTERHLTVTFNKQDYDDIKKKYFDRAKEIHNLQNATVKEVFAELGDKFFYLWS